MPTSIVECARLLSRQGLRHHVDAEEGVIRLVFVARHYRNCRGERLIIIAVDAPDDGHRVRASIARAFAAGSDSAALCLVACQLAADTPLVKVEFDADRADLRLVVEMVVEDGSISQTQLAAMVDGLAEAAETWAQALAALRGRSKSEEAA